MDICEKGLGLLYGFEGKHTLLPDGRYKAYLDTIAVPNIPTIYAGLTKGVHMGMVVTEEEGERMLRKELSVTEDAIERLVKVPLNQHQFSSLTVLVFNIGVNAFGTSTLLKVLNQGRYDLVPAQMARWCHAGGKKINGLVRRRAAEAALFMEPMPHEPLVAVDDSDRPVPAMPQRVEQAPAQSVGAAIKSSPSTQLTATGILGTLYMWWQSATGYGVDVVKEAGPLIIDTQKDLGPFGAILKMTPSVVAFLTVAVLAMVAVRQIMKRYSGTSV